MGCGSSSLKGEKVEDINAEQPMKRVKTNFTDVDFAGTNSNDRRGTVALAPDEHRRSTKAEDNLGALQEAQENNGKPTSTSAAGGLDPKAGEGTTDGIVEDARHHHTADGEQLKPYQTIDGDVDGLASPNSRFIDNSTATNPFFPDNDPTSIRAKDEFARGNNPVERSMKASAATTNTLNGSTTSNQTFTKVSEDPIFRIDDPIKPEGKKSWLERRSERKSSERRQFNEISDEELQKTIGMTRAEFEEWKKDPKNAVGGHQMARAYGAGGGGCGG